MMSNLFRISYLIVLIFLLECFTSSILHAENNTKNQLEMNLYCPPKESRAMDYYHKAKNLIENKKITEARNMYLQAIEIDPLFCDAMDNLGIIYQKAGKSEEAVYWHQKAIEANIKDTVAHVNLGVDFRLQNRLRESADEYKMAIEMEPRNPEGYFGLGSDYLSIGKSIEALDELKIAEKLYLENQSPYLTHARYSIGLAYYFLNDCISAKSYLVPVYSEFKNDPNINYALGVCHLRLKEIEKGKAYLETAKSLGMEQASNVLEMIESGEFK